MEGKEEGGRGWAAAKWKGEGDGPRQRKKKKEEVTCDEEKGRRKKKKRQRVKGEKIWHLGRRFKRMPLSSHQTGDSTFSHPLKVDFMKERLKIKRTTNQVYEAG